VPIVELEVVWHVGIPCSGSQVVDLFVVGFESSHEVVDARVGSAELLGGNGSVSLHCGSESIGHCVCNFGKFISTKTNEGFS